MKTEILIAERKISTQALEESEQRYQSLLASTKDYVYAVTIDRGRSVATSHGPGCEAVTGFNSLEFDADASLWHRMIHADDCPAVLAQIAHIVNGEVPRALEHRIIHKDGNVRWIRNVLVPQRNPQGQLVSYNGLISDITDRKRAEQLLAVQYAVSRQLAESDTLPEVLHRILKAICETLAWDWAAFWSFDTKSNALQWSGIWHSPSMRLDEFEQASQKVHFAFGVGLPGRAWASGQPAWIPDVVQDRNFLRTAVAARVGLHGACALPIRRGDEPAGVIELFSRKVQPPDPDLMQTLTVVGAQIGQFLDRKWTEETLTTERNLLRTLIDNLPDYVYAKDAKCRFVMNNLAHVRVLGAAQPQDVITKTDGDFFPKGLALRYRTDEEALLASGQPIFNREEPVVDPAGNRQWVLTTKVPWKDSLGRVIGLIGVSHDITERKQAEDQLRHAYTALAQNDATLKRTVRQLRAAHEELKATELQLIQTAKMECIGTLAAGIAHEVKNPLQTILMGLQYLTHKVPANHEGIALALHDMRDSVTRANTILRGLLELSADTKFETKAEDLNACIERSLELLHYELASSQTIVLRHLAVDLPPVPMDRGKMEQVLINLFINALHAMPSGGTLTITTRPVQWSEDLASRDLFFRHFAPGDTLVVTEVQDTGTGIPEALLPKVFDPFFTTKPVGHGSGMGLPVVKKIVDLHDAAIDIRNHPMGGVLVTLMLKLN